MRSCAIRGNKHLGIPTKLIFRYTLFNSFWKIVGLHNYILFSFSVLFGLFSFSLFVLLLLISTLYFALS